MTASPEPASIVVSGTGRVAVEPDVADLRLGVSIARDTVADARSGAARTMAAILAAVADAGVERRDVRTTLLSVQPRYDYREDKPPAPGRLRPRERRRGDGPRPGTPRRRGRRGAGGRGDEPRRAVVPGGTTRRRPSARRGSAAMAAARARADVLAEAAGLTIVGVGDDRRGRRAARPLAAHEGRSG